MKNIFKSLLLVSLISIIACNKSIDELNIDPNNSPSALDANVLTSAEGFIGYIVDVDLNFESFIWAQYKTWGLGVALGNAERFVAQPDDHNGYWQRAYANALTDLKFLSNSEDPIYRGVAKVLEVYVYQGLVDHFGDIPYSNALNGEIADGSVLAPTFDDAEFIYEDLAVQLDGAITDLENDDDPTLIGADDLIFSGDVSKWLKFAHSLKLRILMRLSETNPKGDAITALINGEAEFIDSPDDIALVPFAGNVGAQNPMFARTEFGVGDFYFASNTTLNVFENLGDPRASVFYGNATTGNAAGRVNGLDQGIVESLSQTTPPTNYSTSSTAVFGADQPVYLMSHWEVKFLRAEAAARYGTNENDVDLITDAITSHFDFFNTDGADTYIDGLDYDMAGSLDVKLDIIGVQKWIAMNGTQEDEGWIEARRFDRPASRIFTEGIWVTPPMSVIPAGQYPASWLYPATERSLNPNAAAQRVITDKLFWDN